MVQVHSLTSYPYSVRMWAVIPHAYDMLFIWALLYGKHPKSLKWCWFCILGVHSWTVKVHSSFDEAAGIGSRCFIFTLG